METAAPHLQTLNPETKLTRHRHPAGLQVCHPLSAKTTVTNNTGAERNPKCLSFLRRSPRHLDRPPHSQHPVSKGPMSWPSEKTRVSGEEPEVCRGQSWTLLAPSGQRRSLSSQGQSPGPERETTTLGWVPRLQLAQCRQGVHERPVRGQADSKVLLNTPDFNRPRGAAASAHAVGSQTFYQAKCQVTYVSLTNPGLTIHFEEGDNLS